MDRGLQTGRARNSVAAVARDQSGRLLSVLIRDLGDFQLAEDCLQEALESALVHWDRNGEPASPAAWLLQTARRKAIDRIRRSQNFQRKAQEYGHLIALDQATHHEPDDTSIPDERLRLILTCCHPALDQKTSVALTLRTLCGLTTIEIARAFLDSDEAMQQRLVRARHKISKAKIPFEIPGSEAWPTRLSAVLSVIYLVYNEGYAATHGDQQLRTDLCQEAIRLGRIMVHLCPHEPEAEGLLALMLLNHGRAQARTDLDGAFIPLDQQDRALWDRNLIAEGTDRLGHALNHRRAGPYQMQAAISALHADAPDPAQTDWHQIQLIYDGLHALSANPVFLLNRAVAMSYAEGPAPALAALEPLSVLLETYQPFHAALADLLRRLERRTEAEIAYRRAIALSQNQGEITFLRKRLSDLSGVE